MGMPVTGSWTQASFQLYQDDASGEGNGTSIAAIDTNGTYNGQDNAFRVRFLVQQTVSGYNEGAADSPFNIYLGYQVNGTGGYSPIGTTAGSCRMAPTANLTDGDDCAAQLGSGTLITNNNGVRDTTVSHNFTSQDGLYEIENEWNVQTFGLSNTDYVEFRLFKDSSCTTALDTISVTPRLTLTGVSTPVNLGAATITGGSSTVVTAPSITRGLGAAAPTGAATTTGALSPTRGLVGAMTGAATVAGILVATIGSFSQISMTGAATTAATLSTEGPPPGEGVQIYDKRIKPQPWAWSPDKLDPRAHSLLRGLVWAAPLWEGSEDWARDVVSGDILTEASGTQTSSGNPVDTSWIESGRALLFDYGQEGYALQGDYFPPQGANPRTSWFYGKFGAAPAVDGTALSWGSSDGAEAGRNWGFGIRTTGVLKVAVFSGYAQGTTNVANRLGTYAAILREGDNNASQVEVYVDAVEDTGTPSARVINTSGGTATNMAVSVGGQFRDDGTNNEYRAIDIEMGAAAIWDRALTQQELELLDEDPFILFRPYVQELEDATLVVGGTVSFTAAITGTSTTTADLTNYKSLSATMQGDATTDGALTLTRGLSATAQGDATVAATLSTSGTVTFTAAITGDATVSVTTFTNTVGWAAAITGDGTTTADLSPTRGLSAAAQGDATVSVTTFTNTVGFTSAITGESTVFALLSTGGEVGLTATITGAATVSADLTGTWALAATITGAATVSADISRTLGLSAVVTAGSVTTATLSRTTPLPAAAIAGGSDTVASLVATLGLSAAITGTAVTFGEFYIKGTPLDSNPRIIMLAMHDTRQVTLKMRGTRVVPLPLRELR